MILSLLVFILCYSLRNPYKKNKLAETPGYQNNCPQLFALIEISTNNLIQMSVILEFSVKPSQGCLFSSPDLVWQNIQEPLGVNWPVHHETLTLTLISQQERVNGTVFIHKKLHHLRLRTKSPIVTRNR